MLTLYFFLSGDYVLEDYSVIQGDPTDSEISQGSDWSSKIRDEDEKKNGNPIQKLKEKSVTFLITRLFNSVP